MPGIFGFMHPSLSEQNRRFFNAMAEALRDEPSYQLHTHSAAEISLGRIGLPIVHPHPQPAWNASQTIAVVMEGEIYDYAEHRSRLEQCNHRFTSDSQAELFAHLYEEEGAGFVANVHGVFAAAVWDAAQRQLTLVNDHLGLQPLYYTPNLPGGFAFASGVRALVVHPNLPRTLDRLAVAQTLTFDHVLDDRTLLSEVKQLPAASILTVKDGEMRLQKYWDFQYPEYYPVRNEAAYLEEFLPILRQAFKRYAPGDHSAAILLSGGLDSRVVAALLAEQPQRQPIKTFTFGDPDTNDERYAREVSAKLGMPHFFYPLNSDYLLEYATKGVRITDGLANVIHMHTLPNLSAQAREAQVFYKGFLGDAMIGYSVSERLWANYTEEDLVNVQFEHLAEKGLILYKAEQLDSVLLPQGGEPYSRQVYDSYARAMRRSRSKQPADQRNYMDITQRVPRMTIHGVEWVRSQAHVRLPFADKDLVQFMATVPPGFRSQRKIMKDLFIAQYPELAKIPYTETNYPMVHCRREVTMRANEQLRWWLRSMGLNFVRRPGKRPYTRYDEWMRTVLRPWMDDILLSKRFAERGIFDPRVVKTLVDEHVAGTNHYNRLGALIAIELWHRQFMD